MSAEKSNALEINTRAQRNLKRDDLMKLYTKEELEDLLPSYEYEYYDVNMNEISYEDTLLCNARHGARFKETKATKEERRTWSYEEDEFLRTNYMYLSDAMIALALNIPKVTVHARRVTLSLSKEVAVNLDVVVWCNRDDFDKDMKEFHLTKARPDA